MPKACLGTETGGCYRLVTKKGMRAPQPESSGGIVAKDKKKKKSRDEDEDEDEDEDDDD